MLKSLFHRVKTDLINNNFRILKNILGGLSIIFWLSQNVIAQAPPRAGVPAAYQGSTAVGSYPLSGLDSINYFNGNLDFNLPLMTLGGRGEASFTMLLTIGQPGWSIDVQRSLITCDPAHCQYQYYYNPTTSATNFMLKAGLGPGRLQATHTGKYDQTICTGTNTALAERLTTLTFAMPGGSAVELRDALFDGKPLPAGACGAGNGPSRGTIFRSTDGSGMTFVSDSPLEDKWTASYTQATGYLYMKNGVRYRFDGGKVSRIIDRNGNWISFTQNNLFASNDFAATDSLGRQISVQTSSDLSVTTITMIRAGNDSRTIKIYNNGGGASVLRSDYASLTYSQAFPELDGKQQTTGIVPVTGISRVEV
jgi:hypothetical protein